VTQQPLAPNFDEAAVPAYVLPDPLRLADGGAVRDAGSWTERRRPELLELFRRHVYGRAPGARGRTAWRCVESERALGGAATRKLVEVEIHGTRAGAAPLCFRVHVLAPKDRARPAPVLLLLNNRGPESADPTRETASGFWPAELLVARGYAAAVFHLGDVSPDERDARTRGVHALFEAAEDPDGWGTLAAWAFGASRVLDAFSADADLDGSRVALVGHSRAGKAALWCAAEDTRFAMVFANESGCGGAALSRRRFGETVAHVNALFPHWFCRGFAAYGGREDALPVDQHELVALLAPRPVYVASAQQDLWADPKGEFLSLVHAGPVYALFGRRGLGASELPAVGVPLRGDGLGYHLRPGGHDLTRYDWERFLDFADDRLRAP
jgi:hypothetical protein